MRVRNSGGVASALRVPLSRRVQAFNRSLIRRVCSPQCSLILTVKDLLPRRETAEAKSNMSPSLLGGGDVAATFKSCTARMPSSKNLRSRALKQRVEFFYSKVQ